MKILIKFFIFLTYLILIFILKNPLIFIFLILMELLIVKLLKISFKKIIKTIIMLLPFLIIAFICNLVWEDLSTSLIILERLILAYITTYIFSSITPTIQIISFIKIITKPFEIFGVNSKKTGLIVGIGISMIPILKNEIEQKMNALKAKGYKFKFRELNIVFKPIFISILKKTNEIEKNLLAKGYQE